MGYLNLILDSLVTSFCASVCWGLIVWAADGAVDACKIGNSVVKVESARDCSS